MLLGESGVGPLERRIECSGMQTKGFAPLPLKGETPAREPLWKTFIIICIMGDLESRPSHPVGLAFAYLSIFYSGRSVFVAGADLCAVGPRWEVTSGKA
jgi:hypothetical protein